MTTTQSRVQAHAIAPTRLDVVRRNRTDGHGNPFRPYPASGEGEPLRCCLRMARAGESIALISFAPFDHPSVWTEVGPVYVHAERCGGHTAGLADELRTGPRLLRTYRDDDTMNFAHNTLTGEAKDLQPELDRLLALA